MFFSSPALLKRPREPSRDRVCHVEQWQRRTICFQTDLIRLFARLRRLAEIGYLLIYLIIGGYREARREESY